MYVITLVITIPDNWNCPDGAFKCGVGYPSCISSYRFCDGIIHCSDGSDENNCGKFLLWFDNLIWNGSNNAGNCGGNFTNQVGVITSPSYPSKYPHNTECIYYISQPKDTHISLTILLFELCYSCWSGNKVGSQIKLLLLVRGNIDPILYFRKARTPLRSGMGIHRILLLLPNGAPTWITLSYPPRTTCG